MPNEWDFYFRNMNDKLASIFVDLGIYDQVPDPKRPWLLWLWVYMQDANPDGLSSSQEASVLAQLEVKLTSLLSNELNAVFVGRITTNGRREFYYYVAEPSGAGAPICRALRFFPHYKFEWGTKEDSNWEQYLSVLYPSEEELETIKNERVLEVLAEKGDRLEREREVRHWAYFETDRNRRVFIDQVRVLHFVVQSTFEQLQHQYPFGVCIARIDRVDRYSINDVVLELFRLAGAAAGLYDGWETEVVRFTH